MKNTLLALFGVGLLLAGQHSFAAGCIATNTSAEIDSLNTGNILIQPGAPLGSVLQRKVVIGTGRELATCGEQRLLRQLRIVNTARVPGFPHTYETGVPGVGMRIRSVYGWVDAVDNAHSESGDDTLKSRAPYFISYIKTGTVTPGNFTIHDVLEEQVNSGERSWLPVRKLRITGGGVRQTSCQVLTPAVVVQLGNLSPDRLSSIGQTGDLQHFDIGVSCSAGTKLNITFDRLDGARSGASDQLKGVAIPLQGEGMSEGVGVQLLHDKTPVDFGVPVSLGVTPQEGELRIPLQARYLRTSDNLRPGLVKAVLGFTLTYQ